MRRAEAGAGAYHIDVLFSTSACLSLPSRPLDLIILLVPFSVFISIIILLQSLSGLDKDGDLAALVEGVTAIFPAEVVAYYRPGYATWVLAERIVSDSSSEPLPGN